MGERVQGDPAQHCMASIDTREQQQAYLIHQASLKKPPLICPPPSSSSWFDRGFSAQHIPTRWGPINLRVAPGAKGLAAMVQMESPHPELRVHLRLGHTQAGARRTISVSGTTLWKWDPDEDTVELWGEWNRVNISSAN